jgi:hypothetical protein
MTIPRSLRIGLFTFACGLMLLPATAALCQDGNESRLHSDFRREWLELHPCQEQVVKPCNPASFPNLAGDAQTLVTAAPLHIAIGSLAPQNGFAFGLAFVEHKDFADEWRVITDTDAVATANGSWRAGSYLKAYKLGGGPIIVVNGPGKKQGPFFHPSALFNAYAETTSLNKVYYYGLGPNTLPSAQTAFGFTETIAGANAVVPLGRAGLSLFGEVNVRIPQVRPAPGLPVPSAETVYNETTAPGISLQPTFLQTGIGTRIQPNLLGDHLRLHYMLQLQDFSPPARSNNSFRRWTTDFDHEIPFDKRVSLTAANNQTVPDSCNPDPKVPCPSPTHVSSAINHEGSIDIRFLMTGSAAGVGKAVPFYFDPTIGGSNISGQPLLPSYPDYRFRAPNLVLLRQTIEHSLPKVPLGIYFSADEAKVGLRRNDINFTNLRESYTVGLTVHAGGLPVVYLLFSFGGQEGHHETFSVSNVLLGASARPSLF